MEKPGNGLKFSENQENVAKAREIAAKYLRRQGSKKMSGTGRTKECEWANTIVCGGPDVTSVLIRN